MLIVIGILTLSGCAGVPTDDDELLALMTSLERALGHDVAAETYRYPDDVHLPSSANVGRIALKRLSRAPRPLPPDVRRAGERVLKLYSEALGPEPQQNSFGASSARQLARELRR
jgi:hypothetical protein